MSLWWLWRFLEFFERSGVAFPKGSGGFNKRFESTTVSWNSYPKNMEVYIYIYICFLFLLEDVLSSVIMRFYS